MPELPEVQTVVTQLGQKVVGKKIVDFWSGWPKKVMPGMREFREGVCGASIISAKRYGKHIVMELDNDFAIVVHLKMTGHFLYKTPKTKNDPIFTEDRVNGYIHHIFTFSDKTTLEFSDMRKFGWLALIKKGAVEELPAIQALGIDALSPRLTEDMFRTLLSARKTKVVGPVLLEQNLIAGIGNIYRSEALFLAGILPTRKILKITQVEFKELLRAVKKVLREAVRLQGTTDGDFRDLDGQPGRFKKALYVYRRTDEPCKKCGTIIKRAKMAQRSVFFCPTCQR
ncbi:MAG: bifunctional DNA-formamidopyrimidine glycosylase/DNA-(apurinic or apyrimidinic site) lyase [Candidatus Moranbacteria bacterium]|nr:bifunctional DNA-formamidopyrimidine glycosylase/DNA-(apurinic or apyrimidinic site) lyase [Candidatus Moranbacteria bacterium]